MKKFQSFILGLFVAGGFASVNAQQAGAPGGAITINTNGNEGVLGHTQSGNFGNITLNSSNWAALGQSPNIMGFPLTYGLRLQRSKKFALFNLIPDANSGEDLVIGFGDGANNSMRFRFISNQFDASGFTDIMVASGNGNVGINRDPGNVAQLDIENDREYGIRLNTDEIQGSGYGVYSDGGKFSLYARNVNNADTDLYGVYSKVDGQETSDRVFGVFGLAREAVNTGYAIYGTATEDVNDWAGYFVGPTFHSTGIWSTSDRRLKTNINAQEGILDKVMKLQTYTYDYKRDEFAGLGLSDRKQHGFLAQELESVFPEMVKEISHPIFDGKSDDPIGEEVFKGVNLEQMIPVLTAAIQEQQGLIDVQQTQLQVQAAEMEALRAELAGLKDENSREKFGALDGATKAILLQNAPNPFNERTVISYEVPGNASAAIYVFDMQGRQVARYTDLKGSDLVIEGQSLEAGMYFYSLVVNGEEVDMKRMVLTR